MLSTPEEILRAIAEPNRRAILRLAAERERSAGEIASHFEISRPAISQHLGVLKGAGLLEERREGTRRLYSARREAIADLREYLDGFWSRSLMDLKREAEAAQRRRSGASAN